MPSRLRSCLFSFSSISPCCPDQRTTPSSTAENAAPTVAAASNGEQRDAVMAITPAATPAVHAPAPSVASAIAAGNDQLPVANQITVSASAPAKALAFTVPVADSLIAAYTTLARMHNNTEVDDALTVIASFSRADFDQAKQAQNQLQNQMRTRASDNSGSTELYAKVLDYVGRRVDTIEYEKNLVTENRQNNDQLVQSIGAITANLMDRARLDGIANVIANNVDGQAVRDRFNNDPDNANDAAKVWALLAARSFIDFPITENRIIGRSEEDNAQAYGPVRAEATEVLRNQFFPASYMNFIKERNKARKKGLHEDHFYIPSVDIHAQAFAAFKRANELAKDPRSSQQAKLDAGMREAVGTAANTKALTSEDLSEIQEAARQKADRFVSSHFSKILSGHEALLCMPTPLIGIMIEYTRDREVIDTTADVYARDAWAIRYELRRAAAANSNSTSSPAAPPASLSSTPSSSSSSSPR